MQVYQMIGHVSVGVVVVVEGGAAGGEQQQDLLHTVDIIEVHIKFKMDVCNWQWIKILSPVKERNLTDGGLGCGVAGLHHALSHKVFCKS